MQPIHCRDCDDIDVMKHGTTAAGNQRYRCQNPEYSRSSFIREYGDQGSLPEVKRQISDMAINGSGVRDTARVLGISLTTVLEALKKRPASASSQGSGSSRT
ncbi:MAG: IS1-like element transposase [Stenomitos frigidus ULC029]